MYPYEPQELRAFSTPIKGLPPEILIGWGGRTRTSEWRNQKQPMDVDLYSLFDLMVHPRCVRRALGALQLIPQPSMSVQIITRFQCLRDLTGPAATHFDDHAIALTKNGITCFNATPALCEEGNSCAYLPEASSGKWQTRLGMAVT